MPTFEVKTAGAVPFIIVSRDKDEAVTYFIDHEPPTMGTFIQIHERGTDRGEDFCLLTPLELLKRHKIRNKDFYSIVNDFGLDLSDDWCNLLRSNAAWFKYLDLTGQTPGENQ